MLSKKCGLLAGAFQLLDAFVCGRPGASQFDKIVLLAALLNGRHKFLVKREIQKLFSRFQQPCSCCGLFSSQSRASDKNYVGRILPMDSIVTSA
jgi:hypothetical protein